MNNNQSIFLNPYVKTLWVDQIEDFTLPEWHPDRIITHGTPFTAEFANNIEEGIYTAHERIIANSRELQRIRVQMDLKERTNNGLVFYDTLDGQGIQKMSLDNSRSVITAVIGAQATSITVADASQFAILTEVTIYDGNNSEDIIITQINGNILTVSPTVNSYTQGAVVARSTVSVDTVKQLMSRGRWGTYTLTLTEV